MNAVERVKTICKERKIPISKLESDCGFANGYISQLRKGVFPDDRILKIAEYLDVSVDYLMTGRENDNAIAIGAEFAEFLKLYEQLSCAERTQIIGTMQLFIKLKEGE